LGSVVKEEKGRGVVLVYNSGRLVPEDAEVHAYKILGDETERGTARDSILADVVMKAFERLHRTLLR
jgi:hypothetical protein